jgi:hypothetical protein
VPAGGLRREVSEVEGRRLELEGFGTGNGNALGFQSVDFVGVISEDDEGCRDTEKVADLGDVVVIAVVFFEAHRGISLKGRKLVERRLDEHAVAGFADVADATAFLHQVEDDAVALLRDDLECPFELLHAIAVAAA